MLFSLPRTVVELAGVSSAFGEVAAVDVDHYSQPASPFGFHASSNCYHCFYGEDRLRNSDREVQARPLIKEMRFGFAVDCAAVGGAILWSMEGHAAPQVVYSPRGTRLREKGWKRKLRRN